MGGRVVVVTDSTAYLPDGLADELSVRVVPLQVVLGGLSGAEGSEVTPAQVAAALAAWVPVSTSRPTPAEFAGTWDSARLAAAEVGAGSIRVVDSRSAAMGLGFAVLAAAEAAAKGGSR